MPLGTIMLVLLVLLLIGGLVPLGSAPMGHGYGYGWGVPGVLGPIVIILLVLVLLGAI